jgi:zinc protease
MKKSLFLFFSLSILLFVGCKNAPQTESYAVQQQKDVNGYTYETVSNDPTGLRLYTLENGLRVYLSQNNDEPRIQTYVAVHAGSSYDPKASTGLAHYLEHMLFKGTDEIGTSDYEKEKVLVAQIADLYEQHRSEKDTLKKEQIYRKIDSISYIASGYTITSEYDKMVGSLGATGTNAHTSAEETVYHNKIPANELDKFLRLESEKFSQVVLRLFHTELEAVYEEYNRGLDSDPRKVFYALMEGIYPTHPYGQQTTLGTSEHLKNPSMVEINNYFDTYYVPNNMALVLVGDLEFDKTIKMVDKTFGKLVKKDLEYPDLPKEEPITGIVVKEVFGPTSENISMGFRAEGIGSKDEKYIRLIDMILANSSAGLIDLNLNQKKLVQNATSWTYFLNDYGMIAFDASPKEGQSLDEVKDLVLLQIEKVKKGEFDDWMIDAVINDLKLSQMRQYESSTALAGMYYDAFIHDEQWKDELQFLEDLRKISKEELVAFANTFFRDNYVIVYKRQGIDKNIVKVKNPEITPIQLDREGQSDFFVEFNALESEDLQPEFVDYKKEIQTVNLESGIELSYIQNKKNDLFNLNVIFDMGQDNDKKLALAVGYLDYLGTSTYSAEALAKEFYKLGVNHSVSVGNDRCYVSVSGLQENMDKGLELLEQLLADATVDQEAYDKYVSSILKARMDGKTEKGNILRNGLMSYAQYGENSRLREIYTADELKAINPSELVAIIKDLENFKHRIFYYGKDEKQAIAALNKNHVVPAELKDYPVAKQFEQLETGGEVYFSDFDMVQTELYLISKGEQFDSKKLALASVFNSYFGDGFSSIVLSELRESQSLAYAASAGYLPASNKDYDDRVYAYIGTQANKLPQAVDAIMKLMNNMPEAQENFNKAKNEALKQIAAQRITKSNIFWNYESLKKRGIDYDNREEIYNEIQNMTMADLSNFFNENVKGKNYSVAVIGNKNDMDMKALSKLGQVHEMDVDYLFNYKEVEVKQ